MLRRRGRDCPRQLEFLYYPLRDGFSSTLLLVSASPHPLDFVLAIHSRSGQTLIAPSQTIQPQEKLALDLAQVLGKLSADVAGDLSEGSIPSLIAQGRITDVASGFSTTLYFPDPALQRVRALHPSGVPIGMPSKDSPYAGTGVYIPRVILRNLVESTQNVVITVEYPPKDGPARQALAPLVLGPYETRDVPPRHGFWTIASSRPLQLDPHPI